MRVMWISIHLQFLCVNFDSINSEGNSSAILRAPAGPGRFLGLTTIKININRFKRTFGKFRLLCHNDSPVKSVDFGLLTHSDSTVKNITKCQLRNSTVCLCIFSRSAFTHSEFYPTFRSIFPQAEFRILHVRDFLHSAIRIPHFTGARTRLMIKPC